MVSEKKKHDQSSLPRYFILHTGAIPSKKLEVIKEMVKRWRGRKLCTKRQLQWLKCVNSARYFLNRMPATLHSITNPAKDHLDYDFQRDLKWFDSFLPLYNGVLMYAHAKSKSILELDACLTGLGVDGTILCTIFL